MVPCLYMALAPGLPGIKTATASHQLGPLSEPLLLIILTFSGCFIGDEIIKYFTLICFVFGLKLNGKTDKTPSNSPATTAGKKLLN